MTRTDNPAEVGTHVFTRSGNGQAPFRCVGYSHRVGPLVLADGSQVGYEGQPMGTCDHCGTGIAECFEILSADGKRFIVGSSCVFKTNDAGLIRQYKNNPDFRKAQAAKRAALDSRKSAALAQLIEDHAEALRAMMLKKWDGSDESQYDYLKRVVPMCGAAGRARYLKSVKTLLGQA